MNQQECVYCGAVTPWQQTACSVCGSKLPEIDIQPSSSQPSPANDFDQNFQKYQQTRSYRGAAGSRSIPLKCINCGQPAPNGRTRCFNCNAIYEQQAESHHRRRSIILTSSIGLIVLLATALYFYVDFSRSPASVLKKYEKATGVDQSLNFKNYVLSGSGHINIRNEDGNVLDKNFVFEFVYEKPDKYSIKYTSVNLMVEPQYQKLLILKRFFDGVSHKQFYNLKGDHFSQNSTAQISDLPVEDIANREMGLGLSEYDSIEIDEDIVCKNIDAATCLAVSGMKSYKVEEKRIEYHPSREVTLRVRRKHSDLSLKKDWLVFDGENGFLVSEAREGKVEGLDQFTTIKYKDYKKFRAPAKTFYGREYSRDILIPSELYIDSNISGEYSTIITLKMEKLDFNQTIADDVYQLPPVK